MPKLSPVRGADGSLADVEISYPMDLTAQMLEYLAAARAQGPGTGPH
jgi:dipeptidyl-peptidase-3